MSAPATEILRAEAARFKEWCIAQALPRWATNGMDAQRGGFFEKLDPSGVPVANAIRRLRVQARQIYVYAHAAQAGWYDDGVRVALHGFDYLMDKGHTPDGAPGFVHLLTPEGGIENPLRDTYDHMFVILACAWLARATGDAQIRAVAQATLDFVDEKLTDKQGALLEGLPSSLPRRQNPSMHAFELMLALHETCAWPGALERAAGILKRLTEKFIDPASGRLREYFKADWSVADGRAGQVSEPGHMAEWAWLLHRYRQLSGADVGALPQRFLTLAGASADTVTGLLADESDLEGTIARATFRMWPQTEALKGWLALAESGQAGAADEAVAAYRRLKTHYLSDVPTGCWCDQRDAAGQIISDHIPASSFYHIFVAAHEMDRVSNGISSLQQALP